MKKFLIKSGLFLLLFLGVNSLFTLYLDFQLPRNVRHKLFWVFSHQQQHFDFVIAGHSRAFNLVDIPTIQKKTNTTGLNIALGGSGLTDNYLIFRKFIENGNHVKNLIVQIDIYSLNSAQSFGYPFHDFLFLPYIYTDYIGDAIKRHRGWLRYFFWKYLPCTRYIEFNSKYDLEFLRSSFRTDSGWNRSLGSKIFYDLNYKNFKKPPARKYSVAPIDSLYLEKLLEFTREQTINVVFYTAPVYYKLQGYHNTQIPDRFLQEICQKYQIPHLDFTALALCQNQYYFRDYNHLNSAGTLLFSEILSDSLNHYLKR